MLFTDSVKVSGLKRVRSGYAVVDAAIARTGIQEYWGSELGRPELTKVRLYRPEKEVFSDKALKSFASQPVTEDHPSESVTSENWKEVAVGITSDTVIRDGDHVRLPFMLMDEATINKVDGGKKDLSAGYTAEIDWTPGKTSSGEDYDASLFNITGNHLAIVDVGRAGATCRIGDSWTAPVAQQTSKEKAAMAENTRTVMHDGVSFQMNDQAAQLLETLKTKLKDSADTLVARDGTIAALRSSHETALGAKDKLFKDAADAHAGALAAKDAEISNLKKLTDSAHLDDLIQERATIATISKQVIGDAFDPAGKSVLEMQRAVVAHRLGDAAVKDKPETFIVAAFDTLHLADAKADPAGDPLRTVLAAGNPTAVLDAAASSAKSTKSYKDRIANRWKQQGSK